MSEILIKQIKPKAKAEAKPKAESKAKAEPKAKPEAKPKAEAKPKPEAKEPKAKAEPKPKAEKANVIIREIVKHIPKVKRAPTAYNKFIGDYTKGTGKTFTDATNAWKAHKAEQTKEVKA